MKNDARAETALQQHSKPEVWNISVADGDPGIGQKQAVDTGQ